LPVQAKRRSRGTRDCLVALAILKKLGLDADTITNGAEALRSVAFEMEKAAADGDLDAVGRAIQELETQFQRLKNEMEKGL